MSVATRDLGMIEKSALKKNNIILIAGPTASGKSQLALSIAKKNGAVIINADSMQVYDQLRVITARPFENEMQNIPHHLYGHVDVRINYSTGQWLNDVKRVLTAIDSEPVIFVGGTGLYFKTLLEGLADIPDVPDDIRLFCRTQLQQKGILSLYEDLQKHDPHLAKKIKPTDGQRISRGLEVWQASGKPLSYWQTQRTTPLICSNLTQKILLLPERQLLYQRINNRFDKMIELGALDEVSALNQLHLSSDLPTMKAIGVPELTNYLAHKQTLEDAIETAKMRTRHYAKRQITWFRHQFDESWLQRDKIDD